MKNWNNYNDADDLPLDEPKETLKTDEVKNALIDRLGSALRFIFPNGRVNNDQFLVGDIDGNTGKSLVIELSGSKAGVWTDFATGGAGDIFDLWAHHKGLDVKSDFSAVLASVAEWLGTTPAPSKQKKKTPPMDELGPPTARWDYKDRDGNWIACVYRYDTPNGKEFRLWDVKAKKYRAPEPRPLYNQPEIAASDYVILVEGEKCADALMANGNIATTAMNGANAPVDKTDWTPLKGKHVLIWPDNDDAGKEYAHKAAQAIVSAGGLSVKILQIPEDMPLKWDSADGLSDGLDIVEFLTETPAISIGAPKPLKAFTVGELFADDSPVPDDIIAPRIVTPGGLAVLGGAAKVGKSDFILSMLMHMAAGEEFLGMRPTRRLRIFYLQAEVQYHYLRERLKKMNFNDLHIWKASGNLIITPQLKLCLNDAGLSIVKSLMQEYAEKEPIDLIVIDPLRNVFDGGENEKSSENDNNAMMFFLQERVERLRDEINPDAGIIIVHHTKKLDKRAIAEDPFLSFSGASSLRGYYTTGMILFRPEENHSPRVLKFELRNGEPIQDKWIDKKAGRWHEIDRESERLVNQNRGEKLDAERRRKHDVILELIFEEAKQGRVYTTTSFAENFEGREGLGGNRTIQNRIGVLATKGYIKYFDGGERYDIEKISRTKFGYLCTEGMMLKTNKDLVDMETGEVRQGEIRVYPDTYKSRHTGAGMPVENPHEWVYQDFEMGE